MGESAFDPKDLPRIAAALASYVGLQIRDATYRLPPEPLGGGRDTYIYAMEFRDAPQSWDGPLALRVYPSVRQADKARREAAVQSFAADGGYPAPRPIVLETDGSPLGLPFMLMRRVPGTPALDRLKNPLAIPGLVRTLAGLQARLHQLSADGCPLPNGRPLIDRLLAETQGEIERHALSGADEMMQWAE